MSVQLDSEIANFDSLITEAISQVADSQKPENLQKVYAFFNYYLQERPKDNRFDGDNLDIYIDFLIRREQATNLRNHLSILSVQQNQLLALYDSGQKAWQGVRDVIARQTTLELQLRSVSKQQISVPMDSTELPDMLPILAVNINPIENTMRKNTDRMQILTKHYFKHQELLNQLNTNYDEHFRKNEQGIATALDEQLDFESKLTFLVNLFEVKSKFIETKRKLYHNLLQIRSRVPEPLSQYTQLYDFNTRINTSTRIRELTYEK